MYLNIYMDKLNIIKIILIFFILKIILKSNKTESFATTPSNTFPAAKTQSAPKKPWEPGFKYGGKDTTHFTLESDKMIGSKDEKLFDDSEEPDLKAATCTASNIAGVDDTVPKRYIYLDERYSTQDIRLPYRTINSIDSTGAPDLNTMAKSYNDQSIKKETDYINILLPNVKKTGSGHEATYSLDEPSLVRLSYSNKKIDLGYTPKDPTKQTNDCKIYNPAMALYPNSGDDTESNRNLAKEWSQKQKKNCFQHNGYCSFIQCEKMDQSGQEKINLCE